ncbi:TauD/TfdA dioxygenase family protein [Streptomyces sp. NPDC051664]|uniref:TauD/TfdA dioxygenase family protein n=1 Tax=Streptomyces sp. NPDC051664 TaxID=3365668 RepID=UPI0037978D62
MDSKPQRYENALQRDGTGAVLPCVETPEGGDTIWVNRADAYRRLPEHIQKPIAACARHSIEATFGAFMPMAQRHQLKARYPDPEHPAVRTRPETGEQILFVNALTMHS